MGLDALRKERHELAGQAKAIADNVKGAARDFTADEIKNFDDLMARVGQLDNQIKSAEETMRRMEQLGEVFGSEAEHQSEKVDPFEGSKTLGEAFVKSMKGSGRSLKMPGTFQMPEVKANTDTHVTGGIDGFYEPWLVETEKTGGVRPVREQPLVADLISWGRMSGQAIKYLVYPSTMLEGSAGMVNEGGTKPQVHILEPRWELDGLSEIAAWFKITDDMAEDLPFVVSEINRQLQWNFAEVEQNQLLRGNGTSPNLRGILNRSGIQHAAGGTDPKVLADNLYRAINLVHTATGFQADGIVINPQDYEKLRLMTDANGQYFAGGIFSNNYGQNTGLNWAPPLWGTRTIISNVAAVGAPIVGAWKAGATGYRKGGLKVESTNSHVDDFTNDRITIRMRTKLGLAVRYPGAFVVLDQAAA